MFRIDKVITNDVVQFYAKTICLDNSYLYVRICSTNGHQANSI